MTMISSEWVGAYFTGEEQTWQMVLRNKNGKIRTKRGWKRFLTDNCIRADFHERISYCMLKLNKCVRTGASRLLLL
ncbi:hypothetical protein SASPL_142713 [Salvia splendens]|uniref:TF-B3 domain-containing protein n=1 Tax=Salvia splendens TaxID=180675 RepID=A0A8X8WKT2_SALSN|nr:hypothetical protein SASPL_142713 [Salvia splendens]